MCRWVVTPTPSSQPLSKNQFLVALITLLGESPGQFDSSWSVKPIWGEFESPLSHQSAQTCRTRGPVQSLYQVISTAGGSSPIVARLRCTLTGTVASPLPTHALLLDI